MNLHQIVRGAIGSVNPDLPVIVKQNTGWTQDATFKRVPTYTDTATTGQVQALSGKDLKQLESLGIAIQGVGRAVYLNGDWQGLRRYTEQGGDMMQFKLPNGTPATWLVVQVLETWHVGWCKVAVSLQLDATS